MERIHLFSYKNRHTKSSVQAKRRKQTMCNSDNIATFHPLEPLTKAEIGVASKVVKNAAAQDTKGAVGLRFEMIELKEPSKESVRTFEPGAAVDRAAHCSVYRMGSIGVWTYVVSITTEKVLSVEHAPQARPMIQLEEFEEVEAAVKNDPGFIAACKRRGIEDMDMVCVDPWSAGSFDVPGEEGKHLCHGFCWLKTSMNDNLYAHPIEGLHPVVDIKNKTVIRTDDKGDIPIPMVNINYDSEFQTEIRKDLKPIDIVQPEGVSFSMEGRTLKWHDWSILVGFNAREGLTLHNISYAGRPVLYRASLAEMVVPYGSPNGSHYRKNVFDIGEYGIGKLANSLQLGCDCLGSIQYLDSWISDFEGEPQLIKNAICIHEEDYGKIFKLCNTQVLGINSISSHLTFL